VDRPLVSIIIVNWNTPLLLANCLKAVIKNTKISKEIIVVDNGSTDGSVNFIKKHFPSVILVQTGKNFGMGTGNNWGLKIARGSYLLVLNTDTIVPNRAIDKLVSWLDNHQYAAVVGPQLRYPDGRIQTSGGNFPTILTTTILFLGIDDLPFLSRFLPLYQRGGMYLSGKQQGQFSKEHKVDWLMGACLLIRSEVYHKLGGFDENIFMYGEEVEWAYRVHKSGFSIWYTPSVWITHLKGGSSTTGLRGAILGEMHGLLYFFTKHKPSWQRSILKAILKLGSLGRMVLYSLLKKPELVSIYTEALSI